MESNIHCYIDDFMPLFDGVKESKAHFCIGDENFKLRLEQGIRKCLTPT